MVYHIKSACLSFVVTAFFYSGYAQSSIPGTYEDQNGKIELKCDGLFQSNYTIEGDTIEAIGKWIQKKNRLTMYIDSSRSTITSHKNQKFSFTIKDSFLYAPKITRSQYRMSRRFDKKLCIRQERIPFSEYKLTRQKLTKASSLDCEKNERTLSNFETMPVDTITLHDLVKKFDKYFTDDWTFKSLTKELVNHWEYGYVLRWQRKVSKFVINRSYTFDLRSNFIRAGESRYLNDTLYSQGHLYFENERLKYIVQARIVKKPLVYDGTKWLNINVEFYTYEIYENGEVSCVYKTQNRNHYSLLFEKKDEEIELIKGSDCLSLISKK